MGEGCGSVCRVPTLKSWMHAGLPAENLWLVLSTQSRVCVFVTVCVCVCERERERDACGNAGFQKSGKYNWVLAPKCRKKSVK